MSPQPPPPSNIRAFVHWREAAVYAGEEIECVITFKNIAPALRKDGARAGQDDGSTPTPVQDGAREGEREESFSFGGIRLTNTVGGSRRGEATPAPPAPQSRRASIVQAASRVPSGASARAGNGIGSGHRPALSLNVVSASSRGGMHSAPIPQGRFGEFNGAISPVRGHGRSLSIISLSSEVRSDGKPPTGPANGGAVAKRPTKGHARSASLQYTVRPPSQQASGMSAAGLGIGARQPSPLYESITPPASAEQQVQSQLRPGRRRPGTMSASNTPQLNRPPSVNKTSSSGTFNTDFSFPAKAPPLHPPDPRPKLLRNPSTMHSGQGRMHSPRPPPEAWPAAANNLNPISRVMSESSVGGTPRTSSDLYSMSNHSDETLTSEIPVHTQHNGRLLSKQSYSYQPSRVDPKQQSARSAEPETLMIGYVQAMGSFTLDSSLVNAAPFEEVKRKGVQGGGGVVGVERPKRGSGMFGALSWNNIGESLGGLLGGDEMSSLAQMKASAGSKSVPLLSTPQSLLFVDLILAPGESKSYTYRLALPRGLPPSHRGRAMKVNYHLAIGVQRPGSQAVKHVEAPFRLLGSYNSRGQTLGHDLMSPYIILQDTARTGRVTGPSALLSTLPPLPIKQSETTNHTPKQNLEDFLRYTERLLEQSADANERLLSPTSPISPSLPRSRRHSDTSSNGHPSTSTKDIIDLAILRSNHANSQPDIVLQEGQQASGNRFNIARSSQPVAVLTILRPAYRLGEAVTGIIDFSAPATLPNGTTNAHTYAILTELESAEVIDTSLALRSSQSIHRVTRRVHASMRENAVFARTVSFQLTIPAHVTPSFETTGVSLLWTLRVEFTVQRQPSQGLGIGGFEEELLEELGTDERGTTWIAREKMAAETFEVKVPIKVYGARAGVEGMNGSGEGLEV